MDFARHRPLKTLRPLPYLAWGMGLFALKIGLDFAVSQAFSEPYSVLFYVSPLEAPLLRPGGRLHFWLAMWATALPFTAIGVWLTLRRLVDARLPPWLVALFFVPFANLIFFLALIAIPGRPPTPTAVAGYRVAPPKAPPPRPEWTAVVISGAAGAVVTLGMVGISVGVFAEYGAALFLGAPTVSTFLATLVFARLSGPKATGSLLASALGFLISFVVMLAFAIEGLVCLLMAGPLALFGGGIGWSIALSLATLVHSDAIRAAPSTMAILPLWLFAEALHPLPQESNRVVESELIIDATPDVVWNRVLAFEELPPPTELIFLAGVSYPTGATIEGVGLGAVRRCRFATGEFVEPITVWDAPRELSFRVQAQPDPMTEMTPYAGPKPPHLDGYFATTRGQFLLEPVGDRQTRLRGRTWYHVDVFPRPYWAAWADHFIHTIHLRVMQQIKRLAEQDAAFAARSS